MTFLTTPRPRPCWTQSPPTPGPAEETGRCSPWRSNPVQAQRDHRTAPRQPSPRRRPPRGLHGKGRKNRTTLTPTTATLLRELPPRTLHPTWPDPFPDPHGFPLSADAVQQSLALHLTSAAAANPDLAKSTSPSIPCVTPPRCVSSWRHRRRRHRFVARPRIHRHHEHLPPRRHRHQRAALERTRQPDAPPATTTPTTR